LKAYFDFAGVKYVTFGDFDLLTFELKFDTPVISYDKNLHHTNFLFYDILFST